MAAAALVAFRSQAPTPLPRAVLPTDAIGTDEARTGSPLLLSREARAWAAWPLGDGAPGAAPSTLPACRQRADASWNLRPPSRSFRHGGDSRRETWWCLGSDSNGSVT